MSNLDDVSLTMKRIESADFETKCRDLVEHVVRSGDELAITKNGEPVAKLSPYGQKQKTLAGLHRDTVRVVGDIVSPVYDPNERDR
ncbi:MAG: type II toxin-antitoxin system prevent-host-death family antitoxin [Gammaproteobacteria bacterium]|nr:type II toxin-antitoxin system prevent-host-death family antitoxin [Gammaproteobacteria bacterium]